MGGAFTQQAAEELDPKCQLVEAKTELDQNACFRGVPEELSGQREVMGLRTVEGVAQPMRHESLRSKIQTASTDMVSRI